MDHKPFWGPSRFQGTGHLARRVVQVGAILSQELELAREAVPVLNLEPYSKVVLAMFLRN